MKICACFSLLLTVGAVTAADVSRRQLPTQHCDTICNEEEEQTTAVSFCGTDGVLYKTKCAYNNALCSSKQSGNILRYASIGPECVTIATTCDVMHRTKCMQNLPGITMGTHTYTCGTDGHTYGSVCELMYKRCSEPGSHLEVYQDGRCDQLQLGNNSRTVNCSQYVVDLGGLALEGGSHVTLRVRPCTMIYKPICGTDGRTYSNECTFCGDLVLKHKIQTGHLTAPIRHDGSCTHSIIG